MDRNSFRCLLVDEVDGKISHAVKQLPVERLPSGQVTIEVEYSSINYKDALATLAHAGVVRSLPHIPGIDAAGTILVSDTAQFAAGDQVIVTGYDLGQGSWGGWAERIRVPAEWVLPLPRGLSLRQAMILGTAGFTAAQCVLALQRNEVSPEDGLIVVTGATGGVGSLAVRLLAKLGYHVCAVTGKADQHPVLRQLGAEKIMGRDEFSTPQTKAMLSANYAGAVDTVGGETLVNLLKSTQYGGCVAACGLVGGSELTMSVYPFLLRGVALCGVASADCPAERRARIWELLAGDWKLDNLEELVCEVNLEGISDKVAQILEGKVVGRTLVVPGV